jgi:hypothetical protein
MSPSERAQQFVEQLSVISLPNVFNPYAEVCEASDQPDAPEIRRHNLEQALYHAITLKVTSIWIAQDLGYRGGRRTGLALTDETHLAHHGQMLSGSVFQKATHGPEVSERTATVIWHALQSIEQPVFLWNVFPFHPHMPENPMSNRCHKPSERTLGLHFLQLLLEVLQPSSVVTIGEKASAALSSIETHPVRHPSYGGQTSFLESVGTIYGRAIPSLRSSDKGEPLCFAQA